jgi:uncharacterized membrane protein
VSDGPSESTDAVGLDRILFFSDAVVAIAITLLALPLVDQAIEAKDAADFFAHSNYALLAAGVSFWMIAASWRNNHALFRRATGYTPLVMNISFAWIASIIALPIATALIVGGSTDRLALVVYLGVFTLSAGLTRLQHEVLARGGMLAEPPESALQRAAGWLPIGLRLLVTVLAALLPTAGLWWLLLLAPGPLVAEIMRRRAARDAAAPATRPTSER